jgi:phospholipid transport system substrate-binding protein
MKKNHVRTVLILILCLGLLPVIPAPALAGEATEQVKQTVDAVLEVLRDKELKKPDKKEQRRKKIREIIERRFDFEEMAKRSLSLHWKDRKPEEKKEFTHLFSDLLQNTYIVKIERYEDEKVVYTDERLDGEYALVKTKIVSNKGADIPVDYKILKREGKWQVYDILVEGVSLVNNYRSQFNQIIRSGSYEELIKKLRDKTVK